MGCQCTPAQWWEHGSLVEYIEEICHSHCHTFLTIRVVPIIGRFVARYPHIHLSIHGSLVQTHSHIQRGLLSLLHAWSFITVTSELLLPIRNKEESPSPFASVAFTFHAVRKTYACLAHFVWWRVFGVTPPFVFINQMWILLLFFPDIRVTQLPHKWTEAERTWLRRFFVAFSEHVKYNFTSKEQFF